VDRRRFALYALVAFAVATAVAIVIGGSRPHTAQGVAPMVVQGIGYGCALLAALDLLAPAAHPAEADSKLGGVVLASVVVLVLLDVFAFAGSGGANIGAGFLRLVCLVVIVAVAGRLTASAVAPGRRRP
jgi:4-amino-4-deoxy-L-arabinose transferase-like glycosyltransferase